MKKIMKITLFIIVFVFTSVRRTVNVRAGMETSGKYGEDTTWRL